MSRSQTRGQTIETTIAKRIKLIFIILCYAGQIFNVKAFGPVDHVYIWQINGALATMKGRHLTWEAMLIMLVSMVRRDDRTCKVVKVREDRCACTVLSTGENLWWPLINRLTGIHVCTCRWYCTYVAGSASGSGRGFKMTLQSWCCWMFWGSHLCEILWSSVESS